MKLLYITRNNLELPRSSGINKKIMGILDAFKSYGFETYLLSGGKSRIILRNNKLIEHEISSNILKQYLFFSNYKKIIEIINEMNPCIILIRNPISEYFFLKFLKLLKTQNPKIIVIIEFPSYPYNNEWRMEKQSSRRLINFIKLKVDSFYRKKLHSSVDFCINYTANYRNIYNIPSIFIQNAINTDELTAAKKPDINDEFHLIGAANISIWHGWDRVIEGLHEYYNNDEKKLKVFFHIVGKGIEKKRLEKLTRKFDLNDFVIFHGEKKGTELDDLYNKSHIGVGSFGMHRIGLKENTTLKIREYCAKGLPFIFGYNDIDFSKNDKYWLQFREDETPIEILKIIDFYNKIKDKDYREYLIKYAKENLSWKDKIQPLIKKIKEIKKVM